MFGMKREIYARDLPREIPQDGGVTLRVALRASGRLYRGSTGGLPGGAFEEGTFGGRIGIRGRGIVGDDLVAALALGAEHAFVSEREEASGIVAVVGKTGEADADGDLDLLGAVRNFDARVGDALTK